MDEFGGYVQTVFHKAAGPGEAARASNKRLELTKPIRDGASQLNLVLDGLKFTSDRRPSSGTVLRGPFLAGSRVAPLIQTHSR
jgi:hypothetical protein